MRYILFREKNTMTDIYTPTTTNPFTEYTPGDAVTVIAQGNTYTGIVAGFPRNSFDDTDIRMSVRPSRNDWFGRLTISAESNWYGNHHISEVVISKGES